MDGRQWWSLHLDAAARLGVPTEPGARFWRLTPADLAREQRAASLRDRDEWLRHAAALAFHASTEERPVTAADIYPDLFGPAGTWPTDGGGEDPLETARRVDANVAAMVARRRAARQAAQGGAVTDG